MSSLSSEAVLEPVR